MTDTPTARQALADLSKWFRVDGPSYCPICGYAKPDHGAECLVKAARAALAAEDAGGWRPIQKSDVGKTMLVTNNLHAKDAKGEMSHRWITWIQETSDWRGPYMGFDAADRRICGITHVAPIPLPAPETKESRT